MEIVYFVYSLAFLALGLALALRDDADASLASGLPLRWLAAFGFIHGTREAMSFWELLHGAAPFMTVLTTAANVVSFVCLIEFGRRLLLLSLPRDAAARVHGHLLRPWLQALPFAAVLAGTAATGSGPEGISAWARLCFAVPGTALAAAGCYRFATRTIGHPDINDEFPGQYRAWMTAAWAFAAYGLFGGLVSRGAPWATLLPWLSEEGFAGLCGIPVQLPRAACAVLIAAAMLQTLKLFALEKANKLQHARTVSDLAVSGYGRLSQRFETLLNALVEGVVGVDQEGRVEFVNRAALLLLGYTHAELVGCSFAECCLRAADGKALPLRASRLGQSMRTQLALESDDECFERNNGTLARVRYRCSPLLERNRPAGALLIFGER